MPRLFLWHFQGSHTWVIKETVKIRTLLVILSQTERRKGIYDKIIRNTIHNRMLSSSKQWRILELELIPACTGLNGDFFLCQT